MTLFVFLPKADWPAGTCPACRSPLDEHGCRIREVTRPNRAERRRLRVAVVVKVDCLGVPDAPIYPCPVCVREGRVDA